MVRKDIEMTGDFFPSALEFILIRKSKHGDKPWPCCESNELILQCLLRSSAQMRLPSRPWGSVLTDVGFTTKGQPHLLKACFC